MNPFSLLASLLLLSGSVALLGESILVQPHNYMLEDSSLMRGAAFQSQPDPESSINLFQDPADQSANLQMRATNQQENGATNDDGSEPNLSHFSAEMAALIQNEHQEAKARQQQMGSDDATSLGASVAHVLMNVAAQAAADANAEAAAAPESDSDPDSSQAGKSASIDSSSQSQAQSSSASSVIKSGPLWYNPKETIPVLKISSMATPSKYKKVYFRSEKKLVDGAFHSAGQEKDDQAKSFKKAFISRRSSRATSPVSSAPPGILQDGVLEFMKKFRDVYVQSRPLGQSANAPVNPLAALMSSAASAGAGGGRPSLASALGVLSAAASKVNAAAAGSPLSQAAGSSGSSSSLMSQQLSAAASNAVASVVAAPSSGSSASSVPSKGPPGSPLSAQTYVSFWSKTFPDWVRKMLKQMRRRSLQNHSKRKSASSSHQQHATSLGQASQAAANVANSLSGGSSS